MESKRVFSVAHMDFSMVVSKFQTIGGSDGLQFDDNPTENKHRTKKRFNFKPYPKKHHPKH